MFSGNAPDPGRNASTANPFEQCVIDSTAYFIRTESTHSTPCKEVLIFGDVEPDSISLSPRTAHVWAEAAPKIASGILTGIFIECSYTNAQGDAVLYGHLAPRHLLEELQNLAGMVKEARKEHEREREEARKGRKRKRTSQGLLALGIDGVGASNEPRKASRTRSALKEAANEDEMMTDYAPSPTPGPGGRDTTGTHTPAHPSVPAALNLSSVSTEHNRALMSATFDAPLKGVKVIVIHVKDTLADGPLVGDSILRELREGEKQLAEQGKGLGCMFEVSKSGDSYWF
jgi:elongation factor 1-gamma